MSSTLVDQAVAKAIYDGYVALHGEKGFHTAYATKVECPSLRINARDYRQFKLVYVYVDNISVDVIRSLVMKGKGVSNVICN